MRNYLFCLRHFNDIDNISPVIHFLVRDEVCQVTVLIYSLDYAYRADKNLALLLSLYPEHIRVVWIGEFKGYDYRVTHSQRRRLWNRRYYARFRQPTIEDAISRPDDGDCLVAPLKQLFKDRGLPEQAVFDQNRSSLIAGLITAIRNAGVPRVVCLPVSPWPNFNVLRQTDLVHIDTNLFRKRHNYELFDQVGQVDRYYSESLDQFFALAGETSPLSEKVRVLGSIRFCEQWLKLAPELQGVSPEIRVNKDNRTRVLILPSHPKNNSFWDEFLRILNLLSELDSYCFVLKPHTRYGDGLDKVPASIHMTTEEGTSDLIDWAEIVVYWSTSVALEAFQKHKAMLCLDYVNGNTSVYAHLRAGFLAHCRDDVLRYFTLYADESTRAHVLGSDHAREALIHEVIHGGVDQDVPNTYLSFVRGELA